MDLLLNIDVPELAPAERFYTQAFGLGIGRRFGEAATELLGAPVPIFLLHKAEGTAAAGAARRGYERHWSPLHGEIVVADLDAALVRAIAAGATQEGETRDASWGRIVQLADPFGHGWCLIQLTGRGYDEITTP